VPDQFGDGVHGSAFLVSDTATYGVATRRCQGRIKSIAQSVVPALN